VRTAQKNLQLEQIEFLEKFLEVACEFQFHLRLRLDRFGLAEFEQ